MAVLFGFGLATVTGASALAASGGHRHYDPMSRQEPALKPAQRYSGSTPIDLSHGLLFNNGTYGARNPEYEAWGEAKVVVPGVSELKYEYNRKADFVRGVQESIAFLEAATWNWENSSADTKPEAVEYSKASLATMKPLIEKLRQATKAASGSSAGDWDKNQDAARGALIEARATYSSLHKNVR